MRRRIRVLEFVTSFCVGGTERQFVNLVEGLRGTDFEVHVACFRAEGVLRGELSDGVPLVEYPVPSLRSPAALARLLSLAAYLRRHRIDVLHATGLYPNVFGVTAAWLARTPVIIASVRDMGQMWRGDLKRVQRLTCRLADAVVTNAEAIAERLRAEGYDPRRLEVIRNGVRGPGRAAACRPGAAHRPGAALPGAGVRRELGIPADAPVVGVICRLDPLKGLEDLLDAAVLISERWPRARFLIVGGPYGGHPAARRDYLGELKERARRLGLGDRVILTGARTDVPDLLPELTVSVLPSLTEGLSNALLESMAAGVPVVATTVGGNPEIVEDGVTGLLVPPADPAALAVAIDRLLASPPLAARLGAGGRRRVEADFTYDRMVERTTDLYRRLLARARNHRRGRLALGRPQVDPR